MSTFQPQADFDRLIRLLRPHADENSLVAELLTHYPEAKILLHWSYSNDNEPNWEGMLDVYQHRAEYSGTREDGPFVFGWETMIPALEQTSHRRISITDFATSIGSFLVFSDAEKTTYIGILKSKRSLETLHANFLQSDIYFHQGKLFSYNQWFENGIWIPDQSKDSLVPA